MFKLEFLPSTSDDLVHRQKVADEYMAVTDSNARILED